MPIQQDQTFCKTQFVFHTSHLPFHIGEHPSQELQRGPLWTPFIKNRPSYQIKKCTNLQDRSKTYLKTLIENYTAYLVRSSRRDAPSFLKPGAVSGSKSAGKSGTLDSGQNPTLKQLRCVFHQRQAQPLESLLFPCSHQVFII